MKCAEKKSQKARSLEHNEGVTYESSVGLTQSEADRLTITIGTLSDLRSTITDKDSVSIASLQESTENEVLIAATPLIEFFHWYRQDFFKGVITCDVLSIIDFRCSKTPK